jgi:glycine/D-amino acid oxidase-like deaminating enzyme
VIKEVDAVVIGAGALGASTAYHLARLGKRVALLDQHDLVSQTSPRAAGLTQQIRSDQTMTRIAMRSVQQLTRFTAETGQPLTVHQTGSIKLARTPTFATQIYDEVERGHAFGLDIALISVAEARRLAPWLQPAAALALWYTPSDLYLEPGDLPRAYVQALESLGASVFPHTRVTAIGTRAGAIERAVTDQGDILTPVIVDTAGAWAGVVAQMTGIRVPIVPTRHQLYVTQPLAGVTPDQPIVRVLDVNVYVRPERGGLLLGGYEPDPVQVDVRALPATFQIADLALNVAPLRRLTEQVHAQFPLLQGAEIVEVRGGLPTMTADGNLIVDRVPDVEGFFVAGGCCVGGLSTSPAVGEALAAWIVTGRPPIDLAPLSLTRFSPAETGSEERLRQLCLWRYAHHYSDG